MLRPIESIALKTASATPVLVITDSIPRAARTNVPDEQSCSRGMLIAEETAQRFEPRNAVSSDFCQTT